ncbi:MAG TPA: ATP-binding domain-containing protein [Polyangia bacterium]|nr:ATP-binding domain-containing protein [Polyangia bacterium]
MSEESSAEVSPEEVSVEIPLEEERHLARVLQSLAAYVGALPRPGEARQVTSREAAAANAAARRAYDEELVSLRDEIGEARLEDVPALVAQMERLQMVGMTRADLQTMLVDPAAPYFGHMRLREQLRGRVVERDVFIGRATYVDARSRVNIVDWRHAPVSKLFYRYAEGSDYEETFGDREVEGEVVARRTLTIEDGVLVRVASPHGVWVRAGGARDGAWVSRDVPVHALAGGEHTGARPGHAAPKRGVLGAGTTGTQALDRHLPEIAALIDPRQFDLITAYGSGVVVIQGGAGSGKTTVGLHRLAHLAYAHPSQYPPSRLLVVTYGAALAAYIGEVLPSLGVSGVRVLTFAAWAERELRASIPWLRAEIVDDAAPAVTRVKSHPALLHELERLSAAYGGKRGSRGVVELWADLLTDRMRLLALLRDAEEMPISERDIVDAHRIMVDRVAAIVARDPRDRPPEPKPEKKKAQGGPSRTNEASREELAETGVHKPSERTVDADLPEHVRRVEGALGDENDDDVRGDTGIDGLATEDDRPLLDLDDAAILLRAHELLCGVKQPLAHVFVDEAQDLSPMKLSVLIGRTAKPQGGAGKRSSPSITLAGDTSQRLFLDNGFGDWRGVLGHVALSHVAIEPLRIAYRSTREILALAREAMGPLADELPPEAPRSGAPVEAFRFPAAGAAVAFLGEALRDLHAREPRATVALLARHPEQADRYFEGLRRAEVPALRRVRAQEFSFRPGVEVTDVRQVKGLEFDYVVMLDANASSYGRDDESRHLFHIGVTRAAHQLWLVATGTPSPLFPKELLRD